MGQKLSLVGSHVDLHWAFGFAAFAGQAEIKCFPGAIIAPAFLTDDLGPEELRTANVPVRASNPSPRE